MVAPLKRLRLLRVVVPALLALFVVVVVVALRDRPEEATDESQGGHAATQLEGFTISDIEGTRRRLAVSARVGRWDDEGGFQAEGIERIEIDRENGLPLIVSAATAHGAGAQGRRVIRLEGGVEIRDEESGLLVKIPSAVLDQGARVARSLGDVVIASPNLTGTAGSAVYPLDGQPTQLFQVRMQDGAGGALRAGRAVLPRGGRAIELEGDVVLTRASDVLGAERLELQRDAQGSLSSAHAVGAVNGSSEGAGGAPSRFGALRADVQWTAGAISRLALAGEALVSHAGRTLQADSIDATRRPTGWDVSAAGGVVLSGALPGGPGRLEAAAIEATLGDDGRVQRGRGAGGVRFESEASAGEGDAADFAGAAPHQERGRPEAGETLKLLSGHGRRARLAVGRTRVVADTIVTTARGTRLQADGRVEATLLPDPAGRSGKTATALFEGRETIHFVAGRLEAEDSGKVLHFRSNVRGWQADRNLSAEEVDVDTRSDALDARRRVSTRFPRATRATPVGGFLQVTAEALRYRGGEALATYSGGVRARQNEGWIECGRLEVATAKAGGAIQEVRGFDGVRFEFNAPPGSSSGAPEPVTGGADRLLYTPDAGWVRLFGDRAPAEVRRGGPEGGTTAGRVLRYALETGRIEVESGTPSRAAPAQEDP